MATYQSINEPGLPVVQMPIVTVGSFSYPLIPPYVLNGILPVSRGGTGLDTLTGSNKFIVSSVDGKLMEEADFSLTDYKNDQRNLKNLIAKNRFYEVNIPASGFVTNTLGNEGFMQVISVPGVTTRDNPVIGLLTNKVTSATLEQDKKAYSCIDNVLINNDNEIIVICLTKKPTTDFTIGLNCVVPNNS